MPVARTSRQRSGQPLSKYPSRDIIVLSSDDESVPVKKPTVPQKTAKIRGKARAMPLPSGDVSMNDVLEIFSEEETSVRQKGSSSSSSSRTSTATAFLQRQIDELQRENVMLKAQAASTLSSTTMPSANADKTTAALAEQKKLLYEMDDITCCEICIARMWSPYILSCGHSFCKTCLMDWFSTAHAQHMQAHPEYNPHPPILNRSLEILQQPYLSPHQRRAVKNELLIEYNNIKKPAFTCPKCRDPVTTAPIECYALKHMVRTMAKWAKDGKTGQDDKTPQQGIWDGFFPKMPQLPEP
ncbi:hypothetical protein BC835DRAFT_1387785 [Cytidiella melzeri]|nr:hypothetical protein BC835DRAFT_1387785 [Cytidiella melzeri]